MTPNGKNNSTCRYHIRGNLTRSRSRTEAMHPHSPEPRHNNMESSRHRGQRGKSSRSNISVQVKALIQKYERVGWVETMINGAKANNRTKGEQVYTKMGKESVCMHKTYKPCNQGNMTTRTVSPQ